MMDMDEITKNLLLAADDPLSLLSEETRAFIKASVAERKRLRDALTEISSPSQSTNLLWWQVRAREALAAGPVAL